MLISSTKVSVSSFRVGVALYAPATAQRHVFWIGCNLAANPLGPLLGLCHIRAANAIVGRTTAVYTLKDIAERLTNNYIIRAP
jgi:hypothetical protein